jgi:hypothetical protein
MTCIIGYRPVLKIFCCSNDFLTQSVFLTVNASFRWLNNIAGVYLVQVSVLHIGQQDLVFLQYKITGAPKKYKNGPVLYLGLKLTIHVIKSKIHLVRQSL